MLHFWALVLGLDVEAEVLHCWLFAMCLDFRGQDLMYSLPFWLGFL